METKNMILYPTDFSTYAGYALPYAKAFARHDSACVECVHVVDEHAIRGGGISGVHIAKADMDMAFSAVKIHAAAKLEHVVRTVEGLGIEAKGSLCTGSPASEIVRLAQAHHARLIVLATHGRSMWSRFVSGSTCERVIRLSPVPVLAVKHPEHEFVDMAHETISLERVLCPCDFSEFSRLAVPYAATLCKQFGATLVLVHVVDTWLDYPEFTPGLAQHNSPQLATDARASLERLASEHSDISTEVHVLKGVPARALTEFITDTEVDLAFMATHGRSGMSHAILGSVTEKLVRHAACPVLTIRPPSEEASGATDSVREREMPLV